MAVPDEEQRQQAFPCPLRPQVMSCCQSMCESMMRELTYDYDERGADEKQMMIVDSEGQGKEGEERNRGTR